jgi:hypothetical protein
MGKTICFIIFIYFKKIKIFVEKFGNFNLNLLSKKHQTLLIRIINLEMLKYSKILTVDVN